MNNIKLLDDITIQQIAAGEIIDRPASIVKEIIENSMDAEANTITVEIKNGGKSYIRVTDNGNGIHPEDIELAFERHSTSKLTKAADLYDIHSFGFRGEALASISAVSKVELLTKTRDTTGTQSFIENGKLLSTESVGCPNGTTIIMKDIFYNFPVRRDFLKSDLVEANRITDTVTRLALGNPEISFKYIKDDRVIFKTPGKGDLIHAIYSILGREFNDNLIDIDYKEEDVSVRGYISKNSFYRSNRSHQYLYVNNRFIKNGDITSAVEGEYKSLIPINRYPIYFLFIDVDPSKVDVNIHPTKQEINFVNQDRVIGIIKSAVKDSLNKALEIQSVPDRVKKKTKEELPYLYESTFFDKEGKNSEEIEKRDDLSDDNKNLYKDSQDRDYVKEDFYKKDSLDDFDKDYNITSLINKKDDSIYDLDRIKEFNKEKESLLFEEDVYDEDIVETSPAPEKHIDETLSKRDEFKLIMENVNILGIVFKTYILGEDSLNKDLIMIDQHAAHERIMYEDYLNKYKNSDISTQMLMSPEVLELSDIEFTSFEKNKDFFNKIGFSIDEFGINSVIIRGTPMIFGQPEPKNIFFEILDSLNANIDNPYEIRLDKIMKLACTSAIKSGDSMADLEIEELIRALLETEVPFTCPHGRPTIIKISQKQIEKDFKRIM